MRGDKKNKRSFGLTLMLSTLYFVVASLSFTIVIWARYFIYKSPLFSPNHVPSHTSTVLLAVTSIIAGSLLTHYSVKYILKPVQLLLEGMHAVANGDYSVRVVPQGFKRFKHLGQCFNNMAQELDSAEILKKDFVNNFSHELKTPITSILGFAKILKSSDLSDEEREEYLDIIISESERLSCLSQNILTLTRIENQSILTDIEEINISEQIRLAVALFDSQLTEKNIEINFEGGECTAFGNKNHLSQVWVNLIDNAIKFSPADSTIRIIVHQENGGLSITFSNHGEVFDETAAKHIFDRFYQADKSHKTSGNGLGLTLVKTIIQNHGGSIEVTSDDEYEVVFRIYLPEKQLPYTIM